MDRYLCIQAFVRVAKAQSFSSAARQLGVTPSVITSRIKDLEKFVQTPLFHRSTRTVRLSDAGDLFLAESAEFIEESEALFDRMRMARGRTSGTLRLEVLPGFALGHLGNALKHFRAENPDLQLDITVSDQLVNPIGQGYDVSLQLFRPGAQQLIARALFDVKGAFCASPDYLARNGTPQEPQDLSAHDMGLYSAYPTRNRWTFRRNGKALTLDLANKLRSNSVHLLRDFARSGGGIAYLPTLVCAEDLIAGTLLPVLQRYEVQPLKLYALYATTQRRAVKVKLFVDFIVKRFSGEPEWDRALRKLPGFTR
jgi:DNA-binding transcriptional LysR family regulator